MPAPFAPPFPSFGPPHITLEISRLLEFPSASPVTYLTKGALNAFVLRGIWLMLCYRYVREQADTEAFAAVIDQATGVWLTGGRQWYSADAYGTYLEPTLTLKGTSA